ncbi:hypothetical protein AURDEDRAFT_184470 [Auricularia subglabra TFB-10046 SS5]|nr:hypothetical protein AURDEDRAFT_184470 [Auricularia subglabra TFB-10046 SS5]
MSSNPLSIPTPFGGVPNDADRIPSIVFALAWAALLPFVARRFIVPQRRTVLLIGACIMVVLNMTLYSIRALQAFVPSQRASRNLLVFMQGMLANGFATLTTDALPLIQAIVKNAKKPLPDPEAATSPQQAKPKKKYTPFELLAIVLVVTYIALPGTLAGTHGGLYKSALKKQATADAVQGMRYASAVLTFIPVVVMAGVALHALFWLPRVDRAACLHFLALLSLITIMIIYRFIVMRNHISNLLYTGPGSLTSTTAKALFYVLHSLPEWIATASVVIPDTQTAFGAKPVWPGRKKQQLDAQPGARRESFTREPEAEYVEMAPNDSSTQVDKVKPVGR